MEELLTHEAKNAAEYYALGAIDIHQLLDICLSLEEAKVALDYADAYYLEYEVTMRRKYKRIDDMKAAWKLYDREALRNLRELRLKRIADENPKYPSYEEWIMALEQLHKTYTDEELQAAYDNWEHDRYKTLFSIGYKAAVKKVSDELIHKFFIDYHCNSSDMSYFYNGYFCKVYGLEDIMM